MMKGTFILLHFLLLNPLFVWAMPASSSNGPLRPTDDAFYRPPSGFEDMAPGTILRYRPPPSPIAAFGFVKSNLHSAYQVLYRTSDSFGNPIATVTTILIPHNADFNKLHSYQVAQDAADVNCSPSFALQQQSTVSGSLALAMPQIEYVFITTALDKGWVVTIPDHLGPSAAFLANTLSGQAVLDNIRAALASGNFTQIEPTARVTMWGYSGGSLATGFAAELQQTYAPELTIAGAALGGTVPKIVSVINTVNKGVFTGLVPAGILGLANEYPAAQDIVHNIILPAKVARFNKAKHLCLTGALQEYFGQDIYNYVNDPSAFSSPAARAVLDPNSMGQNIPVIPLFIYKSIGDEVSPIADSDELVTKYCEGGADVEYKRDKFSEHASLEVIGAPDAFLWLMDRMAGKPIRAGCTNTTVLTSMDNPKALAAFGVGIVDVLLSLLSLPIGPLIP
ncbi:secretory lipase-domain-containing protein [Aspergillus floccosus]